MVSKDQKRVTGWTIPPGGGLRGGGNPIPNTGSAIVPTKAKLSEISNQEFNEWLKLQEVKSQRYVYESGLEMFCIEFTMRKFFCYLLKILRKSINPKNRNHNKGGQMLIANANAVCHSLAPIERELPPASKC